MEEEICGENRRIEIQRETKTKAPIRKGRYRDAVKDR